MCRPVGGELQRRLGDGFGEHDDRETADGFRARAEGVFVHAGCVIAAQDSEGRRKVMLHSKLAQDSLKPRRGCWDGRGNQRQGWLLAVGLTGQASKAQDPQRALCRNVGVGRHVNPARCEFRWAGERGHDSSNAGERRRATSRGVARRACQAEARCLGRRFPGDELPKERRAQEFNK